MFIKLSRRELVTRMLCSAALAPVMGLIGTGAATAAAATLDPADPEAKELGYVADASKVDAAAEPTYKPDRRCVNCGLFDGKAGDAAAECELFPDKTVAAGGWCRQWVKRRGS
jgi:hypothetical protein